MRFLPLFGLLACDPAPSKDDTASLETCADVESAFDAETTEIRSCSLPEECGMELTGTSCGCTRNWVARLDADTTEWSRLRDLAEDMECGLPFDSTCDCPEADGFDCVGGVCTWNYVDG